MTDERIMAAFGRLDLPVEPEPVFAERLFTTLVDGIEWGTMPDRSLRGRIRQALRIGALPTGRQALRLANLALIVALMAALLVGAAIVAALLHSRPSPIDLVRLSQSVYDDPPAVRLTIRDPMGLGESTLSSDGDGTWRSVTPDSAAGSYMLYDGERIGIYDSTTDTWRIVPVTDGGPPYPLNDAFTWTHIEYPAMVATLSKVDCADARDLGEATIAGRVADGIDCARIGMQYWVDRATRLVLRTVGSEGSLYWSGQSGQPAVTEVVTFEDVAAPDPADFAWSGPSWLTPTSWPRSSTVLKVGEKPPPWTASTVDGRSITSDELKAPAAVLFFAPSCKRCAAAYDDFVMAISMQSEVAGLVVGSDDLGNVAGFLASGGHPTGTIPVVDDSTRALHDAWGIVGLPTLVLLGPDGRVTAMFDGPMSAGDLDRVVRAAGSGASIPSVPPAPSPTPVPDQPSLDPSVVCGDGVTCLPAGSRVPPWSGPLLQGGTFDSARLGAKPAVIWFRGTATCDGPCPDVVGTELDAFADLESRYQGRAGFVVVSDGEAKPGDTRRAMTDARIDAPVVFDWDSAIKDRFTLVTYGFVVIDGESRIVADTHDVSGLPAILDRLVVATASPSP